jgi:hypothetical protein
MCARGRGGCPRRWLLRFHVPLARRLGPCLKKPGASMGYEPLGHCDSMLLSSHFCHLAMSGSGTAMCNSFSMARRLQRHSIHVRLYAPVENISCMLALVWIPEDITRNKQTSRRQLTDNNVGWLELHLTAPLSVHSPSREPAGSTLRLLHVDSLIRLGLP